MLRFFLAGAALFAGAALAAPAVAQPGDYYVATPATAPTKARVITRSIAWHVKGDAYVAARGAERDAILCQLIVRDAGALTAFSAGGKPFDAAQLARCNGKVVADAD